MPYNTTYTNPDYEPFNVSGSFSGSWIRIGAYEAKYFTAYGSDNDNGGLVVDDNEGESWKFLSPPQILETVNHEWEPWETISSRLAGKAKDFKQFTEDVAGITRALMSQTKGVSVDKLFTNLGSIEKAKQKIDTPLVYSDSPRREYTFQFNLTAKTEEQSKKMLLSVRMLEMWSSPVKDGVISIELPYVFKVQSLPLTDPDMDVAEGVLVNLEYAALTSIQPTYMAPYDKNGYPMKIELTLTFKEISPLYVDSFTVPNPL